MNSDQARLARKQLERRLDPLRRLMIIAPPKGWVRAIRESLGMTTRQLASRMGVSVSRIPVIEQAEISGSTTLRTLRQAATAMNCTLVYAFVPNEPLDELLRSRAEQKARVAVTRLDHTMGLENQALRNSDLDAEKRRIAERLLTGSLRGLWDEESRHI